MAGMPLCGDERSTTHSATEGYSDGVEAPSQWVRVRRRPTPLKGIALGESNAEDRGAVGSNRSRITTGSFSDGMESSSCGWSLERPGMPAPLALPWSGISTPVSTRSTAWCFCQSVCSTRASSTPTQRCGLSSSSSSSSGAQQLSEAYSASDGGNRTNAPLRSRDFAEAPSTCGRGVVGDVLAAAARCACGARPLASGGQETAARPHEPGPFCAVEDKEDCTPSMTWSIPKDLPWRPRR